MNFPCPSRPITCEGVDTPILNLSSEEPDKQFWAAIVYGNTFAGNDCFGVVYSAMSQAYANLMAQMASVNCNRDEDNKCYNDPQTATAVCEDGTMVYFTTPPWLFSGSWGQEFKPSLEACQLAVNAQAMAYAQQQVSLLTAHCPGRDPEQEDYCLNEVQSATTTCPNGYSITFTVPAGIFKVISTGDEVACLAAANAIALAFAQKTVDITCPSSCFNEPQTATVTCPDGSSNSFTTPAGMFRVPNTGDSAACLALANLEALVYAQDQVSIICEGAFCLNEAQTATVSCPDGTSFTFTVPAGVFRVVNAGDDALCLATANALALSYAQSQVSIACNPIFPPPTPEPIYWNTKQTCEVCCADGLAFPYVVPARSFFGSTQEAANSLAMNFACSRAAALQLCLGELVSNCTTDQSITLSITATGVTFGVNNYWEITAGAVPTGMTFNGGYSGDTITISGTPTTPGVYSFTVKITDEGMNYMEKSYTVEVLSSVTQNTAMSVTTTKPTCAGTTKHGVSVSGNLPPGLNWSQDGSQNDIIAGTPTTVGTCAFTILYS